MYCTANSGGVYGLWYTRSSDVRSRLGFLFGDLAPLAPFARETSRNSHAAGFYVLAVNTWNFEAHPFRLFLSFRNLRTPEDGKQRAGSIDPTGCHHHQALWLCACQSLTGAEPVSLTFGTEVLGLSMEPPFDTLAVFGVLNTWLFEGLGSLYPMVFKRRDGPFERPNPGKVSAASDTSPCFRSVEYPHAVDRYKRFSGTNSQQVLGAAPMY